MGKSWLTDDNITAYFEFLSHKLLNSKDKVFLMNPTLVETVKELEDINVILDPLLLESVNLLLIPINDTEYDHSNVDNYKNVSGTHWSLLVFDKRSNKQYYYDSIKTIVVVLKLPNKLFGS